MVHKFSTADKVHFRIFVRFTSFSKFTCDHLPRTFAKIIQALHEALIKQEELLAYIDSKEVAKAQVCNAYCHIVVLSLLFLSLDQFLMSNVYLPEKEDGNVLLLGPGEAPPCSASAF